MCRIFMAIILTAAPLIAHAQNIATSRELPPFLAPYYATAFDLLGKDLRLTQHENKDTISRYIYSSSDQVASLVVESVPCGRDRCQVIYNNAVAYLNKQATENSGRFHTATPTECSVDWETGLADSYSFVAKMPASILLVIYATRIDRKTNSDAFFSNLTDAVNRQRYESLQHNDPFQIGLWVAPIHEYAHRLLREKKIAEAVDVLKHLVAGAPYDYQAHVEIFENPIDPVAARNSALVVYDNAEDPEMVAKATQYLGRANPDISSLPIIGHYEHGLQLILVPLPPCDIRLVGEAAALFEKAAGIPVRVERFTEKWVLGEPGRIAEQRPIQKATIQKLGPNTNFTDWNRSRYKKELLRTVEKGNALAKYSMTNFVANLDKRPDQYNADPFIRRLADILANYRTTDFHTVYVGVTGTDLYFADTNYVFSAHTKQGSVLSYHRMMASVVGDEFQSRKRLAERMAKELFPPTFATLGIARPTDPTDPYSYANSVKRVDEKTLTLSAQTKDALDKLR
jgi:predicted Zn-dependent protease